MPIFTPPAEAGDTLATGFPARLMWPLILRVAHADADADAAGAEGKTWTDVPITGRIARGSTREDPVGRETSTGEWRLFTNHPGIATVDRIADGPAVYEVAGEPYAVPGARGVHHYEVPLRRVDG